MSVLLLLCSMLIGEDWRFQLAPKPEFRMVFFTAKWCGPCQAFKRSGLPSLQAAYPVDVIDIDESPQWKSKVDRYPTFWLLRDGDTEPAQRWTGAVTAQQVSDAIRRLSPQDYAATAPSGVVAMSGPSSRWSGVVLSSGDILSCAHHGETTGIIAIQDGDEVPCVLLKSDTRVDLSLIRPTRSLRGGRLLAQRQAPSTLSGYLRGTEAATLRVAERDGTARINGVRVLPLTTLDRRPDSISGMSGGPVLDAAGNVCGILRVADKATADAATLDTIREFLQWPSKR